MTDEANTEEDAGAAPDDLDADGEELDGEPKKSGKKKLIMIALPILLLVGGGAGAWFSGLVGSSPPEPTGEHGEEVAADDGHVALDDHGNPIPGGGGTAYYELPQMLVNLSTSGRRTSFLKIVVSLELTSEADKAALEAALPRIVDNFQVYLRELRVEDLRGSAGLYRLREELLFRVNTAVTPARVTDVLFKEMLVQ